MIYFFLVFPNIIVLGVRSELHIGKKDNQSYKCIL